MNEYFRYVVVVHYSEECTECHEYLKELLTFKEEAIKKGFQVAMRDHLLFLVHISPLLISIQIGFAGREYTDDTDFIEERLTDPEMKEMRPYIIEVRDNNPGGKALFYEYNSKLAQLTTVGIQN